MKTCLRKTLALIMTAMISITMTISPANVVTAEEPGPETAPRPLVWDDFCYYNEGGTFDRFPDDSKTDINQLGYTGGPYNSGNGEPDTGTYGWWYEKNNNKYTGKSSWRNGGAVVINTNQKNSTVDPLVYGELEAKGMVAITQWGGMPLRQLNQGTVSEDGTNKSVVPALKDYMAKYVEGRENEYQGDYIGSGTNKPLWFSGLMRREKLEKFPLGVGYDGKPENSRIVFAEHANGPHGERFAAGYFPKENSEGGIDYYWGIKYLENAGDNETFAYKYSSLPLTSNETVLVVVKFDFKESGDDTISVLFNPPKASLGDTSIADFDDWQDETGYVSVTLGEGVSLRPNVVGAQTTISGDNYYFSFGELRYGESYASVTPVGEHPAFPNKAIVYDNFVNNDGSKPKDGTKLNGLETGGSYDDRRGWDSGWKNGDNAIIVNTADGENPYVNPLTYDELAASGVFVSPYNGVSKESYPIRMLATGANAALKEYQGDSNNIGKVDKIMWFSAIMRKENFNYESGEEGYIAFASGDTGDTEQIAVGYFDAAEARYTIEGYNVEGGPKADARDVHLWSIRYKDSSDNYVIKASDYPVTPGQNMFITIKLDLSKTENERITVYFNTLEDLLGIEEPTVFFPDSYPYNYFLSYLKDKMSRDLFADITLENTNAITPNGVGLCFTGKNPNEFMVGELRYGAVYAAVTPVGEHPVDDTLLLWDDFTYQIPGLETPKTEDGLINLITGGPLGVGWCEYPYSGEGLGWKADGATKITNTNDEGSLIEPLEYANIKTSGVYASVDNIYVSENSWNVAMRRIQSGNVNTWAQQKKGYPPKLVFSKNINPFWPSNFDNSDLTLWYSYIIRVGDESSTHAFTAFSQDAHNIYMNATRLDIGFFTDKKDNNTKKWGLWAMKTPSGNGYEDAKFDEYYDAVYTDVYGENPDKFKPVEIGETVFVVAKIDISEYVENGDQTNKVTVWFNPDFESLGKAKEPASAEHKIVYEYPAGIAFNLQSHGFNTNSKDNYFGDFRFGATYRSVTPLARLPKYGLEVEGNKLKSISYNTVETGKDPVVILALYDLDGNGNEGTLNSSVIPDMTVAEKVYYSVYELDLSTYSMVCGENQRIKVMIWDSFRNMLPKVLHIHDYKKPEDD